MKPIAIHDGGSWCTRWIAHCQDNNIPHKIVNGYDSDILHQLTDCAGFMWLFNHAKPEDSLMARSVLNAAELMGLKVFPRFSTNWHFDDKVAQKYLFEALGLPAVQAWVFYEKKQAFDFMAKCDLPIVVKLRRGAGSYNVCLIQSRREGRAYISRMFGRGFSPAPAPWADAKNKFIVAAKQGGMQGVLTRIKKAPRFISVVMHGGKYFGREKGYCYFQKFIPGNKSDLRISIVGNRAWAFHRIVRANDFRASGSGMIDYDIRKIPVDIIAKSFAACAEMKMQSCCFDWVLDRKDGWRFIEVSMGFVDDAVYACEGYWDSDLVWHEGHIYPSVAVLMDFLNELSAG